MCHSLCVRTRVCVCVRVSDREKEESNKLAEMVPSELHDWSIEFHLENWLLGLNGSLWVTSLKHHTGFISPADWSVTRDLDHTLSPLSPLTASVYEECVCVCGYEMNWDYDQAECLDGSGWARVCVQRRSDFCKVNTPTDWESSFCFFFFLVAVHRVGFYLYFSSFLRCNLASEMIWLIGHLSCLFTFWNLAAAG